MILTEIIMVQISVGRVKHFYRIQLWLQVLALDRMVEDRKGYNNYNDTWYDFGVKGDLRRNENNTLWNLDPYVQASWQFLPTWHLDTGLRYSNVHYESDDHYILDKNGDDSGSTDYQKLLPSVALGWEILPETLCLCQLWQRL